MSIATITPPPSSKSAFVISLDFELIWGVRDHSTRENYGANILGAREAVPRMLEMFEKHGVHATWATVGFLFAESRDELLHYLPDEEMRPVYDNRAFSNYEYLDEVGANEKDDPYAFGASLIDRIAKTQGQEIATHTMSHYYCLEAGPTEAHFMADLAAAKAIAAARGIELRSIVFPRNQYLDRHLEICAQEGITVYRGNARGAAYRPSQGVEQSTWRRIQRLADAYTGILGDQVHALPETRPGSANVPASFFLRPNAGKLRPLHPVHLRQVEKQMSGAARDGKMFHLWWHPHNFGVRICENLAGLDRLLNHFNRLRCDYGMQSMNMAEVG
jgi:peptidoglycan/xylan/chitin deacetylase (PgdA/CDA1 family)